MSPAENLKGLKMNRGHTMTVMMWHIQCYCTSYVGTAVEAETMEYLTGVLGLPKKRRGERIFGSNENFSLTFSSTDGATYVKPCRSNDRGVMVTSTAYKCFKEKLRWAKLLGSNLVNLVLYRLCMLKTFFLMIGYTLWLDLYFFLCYINLADLTWLTLFLLQGLVYERPNHICMKILFSACWRVINRKMNSSLSRHFAEECKAICLPIEAQLCMQQVNNPKHRSK